jgi:hypothetical protein
VRTLGGKHPGDHSARRAILAVWILIGWVIPTRHHPFDFGFPAFDAPQLARTPRSALNSDAPAPLE